MLESTFGPLVDNYYQQELLQSILKYQPLGLNQSLIAEPNTRVSARNAFEELGQFLLEWMTDKHLANVSQSNPGKYLVL